MYLTEADPTHTCTVSIVTSPMLVEEVDRDAETRDGEPDSPQEPLEAFDYLDVRLPDRDQFVGRYRLIRSIGRGSTGSVWLAQDMDKDARDVALKIMHADEHDEYVLARYTSEVRALARMDDPHIARIWENGQTFDGKLFIAMELIHGVQLSKFCETWSPLIRDRISLVIKICRGLQHAHQRGILHRDLKPANILVSNHDGEVTPKIIDFGLAKSFHKPLMPGAVDTTQMGCLLGTIGYMSPEQANTSSREVDTRSDVYSVCAILYELLTGTLPIPRDDLNRVSLAKALEMVQHREPDLASRRVQRHPSLPAHAARCQIPPARLISMLQGDLDAILQKGLSKEREQRYQSAGELADDLERYLAGNVVHARRRTMWYVAQKLMRRHWKTALAVSIVSLLFLISWVGMAFGIFWAVDARDKARQAEGSLRVSQALERSHKLDAEKTSSFLEHVLSYPNPSYKGGGQDVKLLEALEMARSEIASSFTDQPRSEMMVRLALARSYLRLGNGPRCRELIEPLLDRKERVSVDDKLHWLQAENLMIQSFIDQKMFDRAEVRCRAIIEQAAESQLSTLRPQMVSIYVSLTKLLANKHQFTEAAQLLENALQSYTQNLDSDIPEIGTLLNAHAGIYCDWTNADPSIKSRANEVIHQHLYKMSKLAPSDPINLQLRTRQAQLYSLTGQQNEAIELLEELEIISKERFGDDEIYTLPISFNLSQLYLQAGLERQAKGKLQSILAWQRTKFGLPHPFTQQTLLQLTTISKNQGRYWQALTFSLEWYQGQCQSPGRYHPKTLAARKQCQQLAALAGVQWMGWSLGTW